MGAVYEATHTRLAGRYAIKLLLLKPTVGSEAIALFAREARITSLLQHPNIVQVIDHNTTADGTEYLVMEYLAGESLAQRLERKGSLPLDIVVGIVDRIAAGLSADPAFSRRPPRPQTGQRVSGAGRGTGSGVGQNPRLRYFEGEGKSWGRQAPEGTEMGTPLYMAPEQIEGRVGDADAATNQFALAVIAYEMLTGHTPFQADTAGEVFALVLHTDPPPMGLGRDVELVVRRGLAKANRQRFPVVTDFSDALRAAAAGRLRETQWAATLAYAAGEVASHDSKGRSGRRARGLVLAGVVWRALVAFVGGGEANRRSSLVAAPPRSSRRRPSPRSPCPVTRRKRNRETRRKRNRATPTRCEPDLGRREARGPPSRRPPPSPPPPAPRGKRPRHLRPIASPASPRPPVRPPCPRPWTTTRLCPPPSRRIEWPYHSF